MSKTIDFKYSPIIIKISKGKQSIFSDEPTINFSSNIDYPRSEFGFHHFIHASKNKLEVLKKFEGKKKVYLIHNQFEPYVDTNPNCIEETTKNKFNLKNLNRNFYKLWEIITIFGLSNDNASMKFAHLGESTGGFVLCTSTYRNELAKKISSSDKYFIESDEIKNLDPDILSQVKSKITSQKSIDDTCDFVTADVNINLPNLNIYEQSASEKIINNIINMSKILKKGGSFVCKFYETFTMTSLKIISMLTEMFENVYFVKPLTSEMYDSEKFAVCVGYKNEKSIVNALNSLSKTLNSKKEKMNVTDLFESFHIQRDTLTAFIHMNLNFSNYQFKSINQVVDFIKKEIYFGEEFHDKTAEQQECAKYWISMFYSSKKYPELVNSLVKISNESIKNIDDMLVVNI